MEARYTGNPYDPPPHLLPASRHSLTYVLYPRLPLSSLSLREERAERYARVTNVERSDRSVAGRE